MLLDRINDNQLLVLYERLVPEEKVRADSFIKSGDRNRYIAAHGSVRILIKHILGIEAEISISEFGKPQLLGSSLQFNLSHSGNVILMAFSLNNPVGIDVEERREIKDLDLIAGGYFHELEVKALSKLNQPLLSQAFFSCWAKKEAVIKALGLGLSMPLNAFEVEIVPIEGICHARLPDRFPKSWTLRAFNPLDGYAAAIASPALNLKIRAIDLNYAALQQLA
jgi:4'-phosphopantetheinyl transferase